MVHKVPRRPRGRPRAYDPDAALRRATEAFWRGGYSATSLDALAAATGMNRPSLYGAFGDKRALYLKALERYTEQSAAGTDRTLDYGVPLAQALRQFYEGALGLYLPEKGPPRGCFLIGTAATEAIEDPLIRRRLHEGLRMLEDKLAARFRHAKKAGELPASADPAALARMAVAALHSLAVRSRAGESREALQPVVDAALAMLAPGRR